MEFQITQIFQEDSFAFEYFNVAKNATKEQIEAKAIRIQKASRKKREKSGLYFFGPPMENEIIKVQEWHDGDVVPDGIAFKTRWR